MAYIVNYALGQELYIAPIYSGQEGVTAIVTKIGLKYIHAVSKKFAGTDSEKINTFKIDRDSNKSQHIKPLQVYESKDQYAEQLELQKKYWQKIVQLKELHTKSLSDDQIDRILAIAEESLV